jgi:2OG-Fe(II) oxygenase superfamily
MAHVDTPRSENQFASLVVCLPPAHEGGALVVRHNNRSIEFDWSGPASDMIQWAAFYSDCEHEVMPLTSGHRITLTYNLYYQVTHPQPGHTVLPVHSFPIYHDLQAALLNSGFLRSGGILGFYCNHACPHSNERLRKGLPAALKGIDLLVYAVCRSLDLRTKARPILKLESEFDDFLEELSSSDHEDCARKFCRRNSPKV